ncbi:hypothetical protein K5D44_24110, partial [Pseudomonas cichorii]
PPQGGAEPGAMALVTLAETKVTRRKGARRPQAEHSICNNTAPGRRVISYPHFEKTNQNHLPQMIDSITIEPLTIKRDYGHAISRHHSSSGHALYR